MQFSQLISPPPIDDDTYYSSRLPGLFAHPGSDDAPLLTVDSAEPSLPCFDDPTVSEAWMTSFFDMPHVDFVLFPDTASSPILDGQDAQATPMSETIPLSSISLTSTQTEETLSNSVADLFPPNQNWQPQSDEITASYPPDNAKGGKPVRRPHKLSKSQYQHHIVSEQRYRQSLNQSLRGLQAALPGTDTPTVAAPLQRGEDGDEDDGGTTKKKKERPAQQKRAKATKANVISRALAYIEELDHEYMEWEAKNTRAASMIVQHHWALVNNPANTFSI
ncbi:hypothetical protein PG989_005736 [Apiospora arundinis]